MKKSMKYPLSATFGLAAVAIALPSGAYAQMAHVGPRIEVLGGSDAILDHDRYEGSNDNIPDDLHGIRVGLAAGYDMLIAPRLTLGGEIGAGINLTGKVDATLARDKIHIVAGRDLDITTRIGFALTRSAMIYGKIGYANSKLRFKLSEYEGDRYTTSWFSGTSDGLRLGAGIEHAFSRQIYGKAEYRWTDYGGGMPLQDKNVRHQVLLGAGIRL